MIKQGPLAGCIIHAPLNERIAFGLGWYEPPVMGEVVRLTEAGSVFYDVGAHVGYFSMLAARRGARVFSFEANPENLSLLETNARANSFGEITAIAHAVAERTGTLRFATFGFSLVGCLADEHTPSDANIIETPCLSLDDFVFHLGHEPPTLIKIDVEGAEGRVLRGMPKLLASHTPTLLIEIHGESCQEDVLSTTGPIGYSWQRLDNAGINLVGGEVGQFLGSAHPG